MKKVYLSIAVTVLLISFLGLNLKANCDDGLPQDCNVELVSVDELMRVKSMLLEVMEQYTTITSRFAKLQMNLPDELRDYSSLFHFGRGELSVDRERNVMYGTYDLNEIISSYKDNNFLENQLNPIRINSVETYATIEQLNALASQVNSQYANITNTFANIMDTMDNLDAQLTSTAATVQSLVNACGSLNAQCQSMSAAVEVKQDGSVIICHTSPIIGNIEPQSTPYLFNVATNWNLIFSKFAVSKDTYLKTITLYCNDPQKIQNPRSVYISTAFGVDGDNSMTMVCPNTVDTSAFPRCVYTFNNPTHIYSGKEYLLGLRNYLSQPIYPYICNPYRGGGLYKEIGASEEFTPFIPPEPPDPNLPLSGNIITNIINPFNPGNDPMVNPTPGPSLDEWYEYYFLYHWTSCTTVVAELWSILKFTDDTGFEFSTSGLSVEKGNISVEGSEVLTAANVGNIIETTPSILNSTITWNSLTQALKDKLITTDGTNVIGDLTVTNLYIPNNGNWLVGLTDAPSDLVMVNTNSHIRSENGDLRLASPGGKIKAESFFSFSSNQVGKVIVPPNTSQQLIRLNVSEDTMVLVTPAQNPEMNYWVSYDEGCVFLNLEEETEEPLTFFYLILED